MQDNHPGQGRSRDNLVPRPQQAPTLPVPVPPDEQEEFVQHVDPNFQSPSNLPKARVTNLLRPTISLWKQFKPSLQEPALTQPKDVSQQVLTDVHP